MKSAEIYQIKKERKFSNYDEEGTCYEKFQDMLPIYIVPDEEDQIDEIKESIKEIKELSVQYKNNKEYQNSFSHVLFSKFQPVLPPKNFQIDLPEPFSGGVKPVSHDINLKELEDRRISKFFSNDLFLRPDRFSPMADQKIMQSIFLSGKMKKDEIYNLLMDIFNSHQGRILNVYKILALFPQYLRNIFRHQQELMRGLEGPLPIPWRYYLAIMAASQRNCEYLTYFLKEMFLASGGNETWLVKGFEAIPKKLQRIRKFNDVLAQNPKELLKGDILCELRSMKNLKNPKDKWHFREIIHAGTILSSFHKFSDLCNVIGLNIEVSDSFEEKLPSLINTRSQSDDEDSGKKEKENIPKFIEMLKQGEKPFLLQRNDPAQKNQIDIDFSQLSSGSSPQQICMKLEKYIGPSETTIPKFTTEEFKEEEDIPSEEKPLETDKNKVLSHQEYNWESHASPLLTSHFEKIGRLLNSKFKYVSQMTNKQIFEQEQETLVLRRAIEHYSLYLHGYYCVGYHYKKVCQELLPDSLRQFLSKLMLRRANFEKKDLKWDGLKLSDGNILHVVILALEAKNKVQMIYLMKSLEDEQKNKARLKLFG